MLLRKKLDLTFSYLKSVIANPAVLVATIFLLHQIHSFAATPGLPFTEDFTDSSLKDPATIANWSTRLGRIEQAQRKATSVGFGPLRTIASDVSLYSKDTRSIHLADVNSDGYLDAIAGAVDGAIYISLSNGTNIPFSNNNTMVVNAGAWVTDIDSGDVDQDGDIDIVLAGFGLNVVLLNNGTDIPFSVSSAISTDADDTYAIKLADVNGDGWLDVVAGNSGASNKLYLNNKTSTPFSGVVGQNISNSIQNTYDIDTADIDNDGDMDVVVAEFGQGSGYVLNNGSSTTPFSGAVQSKISAQSLNLYTLALGDVNNDGFVDVVVGGGDVNGLLKYVYLNTGTATPFLSTGSGAAVGTDAHFTKSIKLVDVNHDGNLDIIAANNGDREMVYLNSGDNDPFGSAVGIEVSTDTLASDAMDVGDVDNDGDIDIVVALKGVNRLYLNGATIQPFSSVVGVDVTTDSDYTVNITYGDIDNDGDLDVVTGDEYVNNKIYLNNGTAEPFEGVTSIEIPGSGFPNRALKLADVNNDGRLDLISAKATGVSIFMHTGSAAQPYSNDNVTYPNKYKTLSLTDYTYSIAVGDINNDGFNDLVLGRVYIGTGNGINKYYINDKNVDLDNNPFTTGVSFGGVTTTYAVELADVNNDGNLDLVEGNSMYYNTASRQNLLYLGDGDATPFSGGSGQISTDQDYTNTIKLVDINRDGWLDVIAGNSDRQLNQEQENKIYLNTHSLALPFFNVTGIPVGNDGIYSHALEVEDINSDGYLDIVTVNDNGGHIRLYTTTAETNYSDISGLDISGDTLRSKALAIADFNGDGDKDIFIGVRGVNRLYHNDAETEPFNGFSVSSAGSANVTQALAIAVSDIDDDGDLDILTANYSGASTPNKLYLNNGTDTPFSPIVEQNISSIVEDSYGIVVADMNGDGKKDVVISNRNATTKLYKNDGAGANLFDLYAAQSIGSETNLWTWGLAIADVNGDGLPDVIKGNYGAENYIYFNNGSSVSPFNGVTASTIFAGDVHNTRAVKAVDMDHDGDIDIVVANSGSNYTYLNNGTGTSFAKWEFNSLTPGTDTENSQDVAIGDVNGDGWPDAVVANNGTANKLYINDKVSNPFTNAGINITADADVTMGIMLEDVDADGDLDVIALNNGVNKYYLNNGTSAPFSGAVGMEFTSQSKYSWKGASGDIDADGNLDIVLANYTNSNDLITSRVFDNSKNVVVSKEVDTDVDILKATLTSINVLPDNTNIDWYMSNDGGLHYYQVQLNKEITFPAIGSDLRWKAVFNSMSPVNTPIVDEVSISARFDHDLDFVADDEDVCVGTYDPDQLDNDGDGVPGVSTGPMNGGDACDIDDDNDGIGDVSDLFPFNSLESADTDGDCGAIDYNLPTSGNGCGDFSDPDIDGDGISNISDPFIFNVAPTISGSPATTATPKTLYTFTPVISDGGDGPSLTASLTFSGGTQTDLPAWLSFNTSTGVLSGVPSNDDYGVLSNIVITVSDSVQTVSLAAFNINVIDTRAPRTFAVPGSGNFNGDATVTIACFESIGSGCANIHYTTDDAAVPAAFTTVSSQSTLITIPSSVGNANLRFYSDDADGNTESIQTETYNFDLDYPAVSITTPASGSILTTVNSIDGSSSDVGTGIAGVAIQITDGTKSVQAPGGSLIPGLPAWIPVSATSGAWSYNTAGLNWTSDVVYTITARAVDNAGNATTTSQSYTFYNTTPSTTTLALSLTSTSISTGQTTDAFLTLTRLNNLSADLTGVPLELHITKPDASVVVVNGAVNNTGNLTLQQLGDGADITFDAAGVYSMVAKFTDTATYPNLAAATSNPISLLVGTSAGYAVIIQGKLSNEEGLESHNKTANRIYETFKDRGFADEDIFYFNYDTNQTGVDALPDKATIQKLIEGSANGLTDPQVLQDKIPGGLAATIANHPAPVYVVMVDHGGKAVDALEARFFLGNEVILPSELNQWLGTLEANLDAIDTLAGTPAQDYLTLNNNRIVIIGACYSGGFISGVSGSGRIVITSATENEPSYKGPIEDDNIRAGEYFLEELFLELGAGNNLRDAFKIATAKTESYTKEASGDTSTNSDNEFLDVAVQHPLLDDDANGKGTNAVFDTTPDGQSAINVVLGFDAGALTNDAFVPADVDSVSGTQYLDKNISIAALTMHANDPSQVNQAYVEIRTPQKILVGSVVSATEQLSSDFVRRAYLPPVAVGAPYTLNYADFVEPGKYEIFSYVNDRFTGALSSARRSLIYKNRADTAPTADDADGINDAPTGFNLLTPNNGDQGPYITGFTWSASTDPDNDVVSYSFYLADDPGFTTFTKDNGGGSCTQQNSPYVEEEIAGTATFVDAATGLCDGRTYYWKVEAVDPYGLHATSSTRSYIVSNQLNADIGVIVAMVKSATTNQQLTAANISNGVVFGETATATASVLYNGNYVLFTSHTGVGQTITAKAGSYADNSVNLPNIASGQTVEILFDMTPDGTLDTDGDGVADVSDNCPSPAPTSVNADQADLDGDGIGDVCDDDIDGDQIPNAYEDLYAFLDPFNAGDAALDQDGDTLSNLTEYRDGTDPSVFNVIPSDVDADGIDDSVDNCVNDYNPSQLDTDGDGAGNICDTDDDGDGMSDVFETLYGLNPLVNDAAGDLDGDGITNLQEFINNTDPTAAPGTTTDIDGDGIFDASDNCPSTTNADQTDTDLDGTGDACDIDDDNDTYPDVIDAFDLDASEWLDTDGDGIGNNVDPDDDNDTYADGNDDFPLNALEWLDTDGDGVGDNADGDDDNDGVADGSDAFPLNNTEWLDTDGDCLDYNLPTSGNGCGNASDLDDDGDGVVDTADAFPLDASETLDTDKDGLGNNADTDDDNDGVADGVDVFPLNPAESVDTDGDCGAINYNLVTSGNGCGDNSDTDIDGDGMSNAFELLYSLDPMVNDANGDPDGDGVTNINEYLGGTNPLVVNSDTTDSDGDGVPDVSDNCPNTANLGQEDTDGDLAGDACDADDDNDGVIDTSDTFPLNPAESLDTDGDCGVIDYNLVTSGNGCGNASDLDDDGDGVPDTIDTFPLDATEDADTDRDGIGDNSDPDIDGDGVLNAADAFDFDPTESLDTDLDGTGNNADTDDDNDGISDAFELLFSQFPDTSPGLDPLSNDAAGDLDGDGVTNIQEFLDGTNPLVINSDKIDGDGDGEPDVTDNCPTIQNGVSQDNQLDTDADGTGDACDPDDDNDNVLDGSDLFPLDATESADFDWDGTGDNADTDDDNDGMSDAFETLYNLNSKDANDATGDADGDGVSNLDEYQGGTNPIVANYDTVDTDLDGVKDYLDNCPAVANGAAQDNQLDTDADSVGDACDADDDNDGVIDTSDWAPLNAAESADADGDGIGNNADLDDDNDGMSDAFEILYGFNPLDPADANGDADGDGKTNLQEFLANTSPKSVEVTTTAPATATSSNASAGVMHPLMLLVMLLGFGFINQRRKHKN